MEYRPKLAPEGALMDDVMWLQVTETEGPWLSLGFDFRPTIGLAALPTESPSALQTVTSSFKVSPERLDKPVPFGAFGGML